MLFFEFFSWWYGEGWQKAAKGSRNLVNKVKLSFSIPVLLKTLFAPWKRIVSPPGRTIDDKIHTMIDNLVSRTIGFFVRIFALVSALILLLIASILGVVLTLSWPLVPLLIFYSALRSITG